MSTLEREIMQMLFRWCWDHAKTKGEKVALSLAIPVLYPYRPNIYRN